MIARRGYSHFLKSLFTAGVAQLFLIAAAGVQAMLLPRFLSVRDYGLWKTFFLYAGFVGSAHFGLLDGAYVRWAARSDDAHRDLSLTLLRLGMLLLPVLLVGGLILRWIPSDVRAIGAYLLIYTVLRNITTAFIFDFQSRRMFGWSSWLQVAAYAVFLSAIGTLIALNRLTYLSVIVFWIVADSLPALVGAVRLSNGFASVQRLSLETLLAGIRPDLMRGAPILLANLAWIGIRTFDRLVVNLTYSLDTFAQYVFAGSVLSILLGMVNVGGNVLFPYLTRTSESARQNAYGLIEAVLLVGWGGSLLALAPVRWLIGVWLPAYQPSLPILSILMLGLGFAAVIGALHSPYFVASGRQDLYLLSLVSGLAAMLVTVGAVRFLTDDVHLLAVTWVLVLGGIYLLNSLRFLPKAGIVPSGVGRAMLFWAICAGASVLVPLAVGESWIASAVYLIVFGLATVLMYGAHLRAAWRLLREPAPAG